MPGVVSSRSPPAARAGSARPPAEKAPPAPRGGPARRPPSLPVERLEVLMPPDTATSVAADATPALDLPTEPTHPSDAGLPSGSLLREALLVSVRDTDAFRQL